MTAAPALPSAGTVLSPSRVTARVPARRSERLRAGGALLFLYLMWFIILQDPQWFIASFGPQVVLRIPTLLFAVLLIVTLAKRPRFLFAPLLAFLLYTTFSVAFAFIRSEALGVAKAVFAYYVISVATFTILKNARQAVPVVIAALAGQFLLWVTIGAYKGQVTWHYAYFNYDSFGPLMAIGLTGTFCVAMSTRNRRLRTIGMMLAAGCIAGLVVSFARGAVLSAGLAAFWIWLRSPNKLKTAAIGVAAIVVLAVFAEFFKGAKSAEIAGKTSSNFWEEMSTSFDPNDATRRDRETLWALARREFMSHPVMGVGPNCFGPYAAVNFAAGSTGGAYDENPGRLYVRALHNTYYQLLSEFGAIGILLFLWMVWDFFARNRRLRRRDRKLAWAQRTGGEFDLRWLSIGLEAGMIVFLATAYFYNQIFDVNWFYTLITINALLFRLTRPAPAVVLPPRHA